LIPLLTSLLLGILVFSLVLNVIVWPKVSRGETILQHVPRSPVPWGSLGALLAVLGTAMGIGAAFGRSEPTKLQALDLFSAGVLELVMLAAVVGVVVLKHRPTRADWGLPATRTEALADILLGVAVGCFALLPVMGLQLLMVYFFGQSEHPLLQGLLRDRDPLLFVAAFFLAAIVAPLFEEVAYRLLFQGWLEKELVRPITEVSDADEAPVESPPTTVLTTVQWAPIAVSSIAFALAHAAHGVDPVALVPLAVLLGYVYQRTHRILPTIVAHAAFNSFSLAALWVQLAHSAK
jgi:membrane protease YdiL (CAAX protease family)